MEKVFLMIRHLFSFCILALSFFSFAQESEPRIYGNNEGYEVLPTSYLFGDKVKLRSLPNPDSEVLDLLKIGTQLDILEKTKETMKFNGIESNWYKVKANDKVGYVLQGLISLEKLSHGKSDYFFALRRDENNAYLKIRNKTSDSTYSEIESRLGNEVFALEITGNRGFEGLDHIIRVNYIAEACMVEGGGQYYFSDGKKLTKAMEYSAIADGGVFWFYEELIFPNDEMGMPGKLIYKRNLGNFIEEDNDEDSWWTEEQVVTREFSWRNNSFHPDLEKFRLKLDEDE